MKFIDTKVRDCVVVECDRHHDDRGFFQELFEKDKYQKIGILDDYKPHDSSMQWRTQPQPLRPNVGIAQEYWKQANWSFSKKNVLRGIHYAEYSKLVTCLVGKVWDVVVDLRNDSPTYLKWDAVDLSATNQMQMYVPPGCGHGFYAYEESMVVYLQSGQFAKQSELTVKYNDFELGIDWPNKDIDYVISERDKLAMSLADFCIATVSCVSKSKHNQ